MKWLLHRLLHVLLANKILMEVVTPWTDYTKFWKDWERKCNSYQTKPITLQLQGKLKWKEKPGRLSNVNSQA